MGKRRRQPRGRPARGDTLSTSVVHQVPGTVVTDVTSADSVVTQFADTWVIQASWLDTTQIEASVDAEVS